MRPLLRALSLLSVLELASVMVLVANLLTAHTPTITHLVGPAHGALYVAATALLGRGLALVPLLSGPATIVNVRAEARR